MVAPVLPLGLFVLGQAVIAVAQVDGGSAAVPLEAHETVAAAPAPPATEVVTGALGFDVAFWNAVNDLRGNLDAAQDKDVVMGLVFLRYASDLFEARYRELEAAPSETADPEDRDA